MAAAAAVIFSLPLIRKGTPDIESYMLSIFSTTAAVRELASGGDPWFTGAYGFGVPLPSSTWLIQFPLAVPAALVGVDWLYSAIWLGGEFLFAFYFLRLVLLVTSRRAIALVLLVTAMLSFSNLGTTYVDDWPEHFLGWAFLPACFWFVGRTLVSEAPRARLQAAAACTFVLGTFTGSTHHNEMVAFLSGLGLLLAFLLPVRPRGVLTVAIAIALAVCTSADVLVPAAEGLLAGNANPLAGRIAIERDDPSLASYGIFLEPLRAYAAGGVARAAESTYDRVPFFGLAALLLAIGGAALTFSSRQPVGRLPNDIARAMAFGFVVFSTLTLLPPAVMLNLPRMWLYRDGQTVLGLLCAAVALDLLWARRRRLLQAALALHVAQIALVAAPLVRDVVHEDNDSRLFGYARGERQLFDRLRAAGIGPDSRLLLAGEIEELVRGALIEMGVTADTDFALDGIPLVNAWYRGAMTPALGGASMDGRYGNYETIISWKTNLRYLDRAGLDVLGITHLAVLESDLAAVPLAAGLTPAGAIALPGARRLHLLRNDRAWPRATLLEPGAAPAPPARPSCPDPTIYCRDFTVLSRQAQAPLSAAWDGSTMRAALPAGHRGGTVFVSVTAGPAARAIVDGEERPVDRALGAFAAFEVRPGDRAIALSVRRTDRVLLTLFGASLLVASLIVALVPAGTRAARP